MDQDRLDDILRSRLQQDIPVVKVPSWKEMERRVVLAENAAGFSRKRNLSRRTKYGIAASIALLFGLGIYEVGHYAGETIARMEQDDTAVLRSLPALEHALSSEMLAPVSGKLDPTLEKLFRSARSVTSIAPSQRSLNPLIGQLAPQVPVVGAAAGILPPPPTPFLDEAPAESVPSVVQGSNHANQGAESPQYASSGVSSLYAADAQGDGKLSYRNGFDWNRTAKQSKRSGRPWMASVYMNANAASASDIKYVMTPSAFNTALVESNYTKNVISFIGSNLHHSFPLTVGFTVKKKLTSRFGIETGLVYSYLSSSGEMDGEYTYHYNQKVHYLGIPLNLSYSLYQHQRWDVYLNAGAMAEFALSARGVTKIFNQGAFASEISENLPANGALWSLNMGAGVSYDFVNNVGIYLEPGASYYFSNNQQPQTYRTENPWSFQVRIGFRFKF